MMQIKKAAYLSILIATVIAFLIIAKELLIPFVFALLLWFIIRDIRIYMNKIKVIKNRFPIWLKNVISFLIILSIFSFLSSLITNSINNLAQSYSNYEVNIELLVVQINEFFDVDLVESLKKKSGEFDFGKLLGQIFSSLTELLSDTFMIVLYALFIFLEESYFLPKLKKVIPDQNRLERILAIVNRIDKSVTRYLKLKTFVSLLTGVLSYFTLLLIGIDSPVFWAFLIFLLNYITTIGSIVGTLFPTFFALLQFGEFGPALYVLLCVGGIQVIIGSICEPRIMGNTMNLSALVTILTLSVWGALWGLTGMILSVPITVIMLIIFSQFTSTRPLAILLSDEGNVRSKIK